MARSRAWERSSFPFRLLPTLIAFVMLSRDGGFATASTTVKSVTWSDIRNAIAETICFQAAVGTIGPDPTIGDRNACGPGSTNKALAEVVDLGIAEAMPLVAVIPGYEPSRVKEAQALSSIQDRTLKNGRLKALFLADPSFLEPVLSLILKNLASHGLGCDDCPNPTQRGIRTVSVGDLAPYVLAFITVDPVISHDISGHPISPPKFSYHVCSGVNAVAALPRDVVLARAGFVSAMGMRHAVGAAVLDIVETPEYEALQTDASRTSYLRQRVHSTLAASEELKENICVTSERFGAETNLMISGCPPRDHKK